LVVSDIDLCDGDSTQQRPCSRDTEICQDPLNDPCLGDMSRKNGTYDCANTCSSLAADYSCDVMEQEDAESSCYCAAPEVFDEESQQCVHPNQCSCYLEECAQWIAAGSAATSTCCPDMTCSCVGGQLECEGSCPLDCVATEWSAWSMCDDNCLRSRERCIVQHADFGGAQCDGGEQETEECDQDRDRCQRCSYNGTEYANNDVVYSDTCYNYICVDDNLRMELACSDGPSSQADCADDELYISPSNDTEAASQNCCGRCERRPCSYVPETVELLVDTCVPKTVDIGRCSGSCILSSMSITSRLPTSLDDFSSSVHLHANCECCKGVLESQDVELVCDGQVVTVQMPKMTGCQCDACGEPDFIQQLQMVQ
jgi:hypothetical protein